MTTQVKLLADGVNHAAVAATSLADPLNGVDGAIAYRFRVRGVATIYHYRKGDQESSGMEIGPGPKRLPPGASVQHIPFTRYMDIDYLVPASAGSWLQLYVSSTGRHLPVALERRILTALAKRAARPLA